MAELTCTGLGNVLDPEALPGVRVVPWVTATHPSTLGAALRVVCALSVPSARLALRLPRHALAVVHEVPHTTSALPLTGKAKK